MVHDQAGAWSWMRAGHLLSVLMTGNSAAVSAQVDFQLAHYATQHNTSTGDPVPRHLRIDKVVFDDGSPEMQNLAAACDGLDLCQHVTDYERMGHKLMQESNDLLQNVPASNADPPDAIAQLTNRELINKFVEDIIFRGTNPV